MKTPGFWFRPPGLLACLLHPLGLGYHALSRLRTGTPVKTSAPLIVVGNVVAGGAGKTPVVMALTKLLQARGLTVHLIAKGYGGSLGGPLQVTPLHTAAEVGDEPLLLAALAPTFIARDRGAAHEMAARGADVVISDDGLQSPRLQADMALLVLDGVLGFGNGRLIPAGPLREPVEAALARTQAIVQIGGADRPLGSKPLLLADFVASDTGWLRGARVVAFAGIGQPEKFFATLTLAGATLVARHAFGDHHPYSASEVDALLRQAAQEEATLVTTAKDAIRLTAAQRAQVRVVEGSLVWRNPQAVSDLLDGLLKAYKKP